MEPKSPENRSQKPLSVIPVDSFKAPPTEINQYTFPEPISRENYTNFLIQSFGITAGDARAQSLWMKYVGHISNSDTKESLSNFMSAGGLNSLIPAEHAMFKRAFDRVKLHGEERVGLSDEEFTEAVEMIQNTFNDGKPEIIPNWRDLDPIDFTQKFRDAVKRRKDDLTFTD